MTEFYIGVMTGTSLDGLDAVLVDFSSPHASIVDAVSLPYPPALSEEMLALQSSSNGQGLNELHRSKQAALTLSALHVQAVNGVLLKSGLTSSKVAAVGVHGQTVRHMPNGATPYTVQLIDASHIAEGTGCTVVSDFRSRDIAAGGQGAPLVPAFHAALAQLLAKPLAIANIGGFANVTLLDADGGVRGLDTGPGNVLMDAWVQQHLNQPYDANGAWAQSGQVNLALLTKLTSHPYFSQALPKSTGREAFDTTWLQQCLDGVDIPAQDVQNTLCQLTACTLAQAIIQHQPDCQGLYVCGGGAHNAYLMDLLRQSLSCGVHSTQALGVAPQHMEALAFAWLARQCLLRLPGNVPAVTGAFGQRVLGSITPA